MVGTIRREWEVLVLRDHEHAGIAVVFGKPITQLIQTFCEGRKASLIILSTIVGISNTDTGIDPCFVDIKSATIEFQDFKRQVTTS